VLQVHQDEKPSFAPIEKVPQVPIEFPARLAQDVWGCPIDIHEKVLKQRRTVAKVSPDPAHGLGLVENCTDVADSFQSFDSFIVSRGIGRSEFYERSQGVEQEPINFDPVETRAQWSPWVVEVSPLGPSQDGLGTI